jgi:NADH-quinone oxidoreductase subunit C/D
MADTIAASSVLDTLKQKFGQSIVAVHEDLGERTAVVERDRIREVLSFLKTEPGLEFDQLSDLAGVDCQRLVANALWPERFQVVYHLRSQKHNRRFRVRAAVPEDDCRIASVADMWRAANWAEREAFDMFGLRFDGHPNLKRILCHHKFQGHALRKDYFIQDGQWLDVAEDLLDEVGSWGENPQDGGFSELIPVNIGPAHPATHGTLRMLAKLDGETIVKAVPEIGYLHRGFEKHCEEGTWTMVIPYTDRLNYCSAMLNNVAYCRTVEKMLGIEAPDRAKYIRTIISELSRIIDHCVCLSALLVDLGALTNFWYLFNLREQVYKVLEGLCGARLTSTYVRVGGLSYDLQEGFIEEVRRILKEIPTAVGDVLGLIRSNRIFLDRVTGIGIMDKETAVSFGWTGPCLRASGVNYDVRKAEPYDFYDQFQWDVPVRQNGDVLDRIMIRFDEILQSMRIVEQALDKLPAGAVMIDDKRVALPPKDKVYGSIEALMNHFVLIYDGIKVPRGESYVASEGANGELGFYIVSDGSGKPYRVRCRPPCFYLHAASAHLFEGGMVADAVPTLGSLNVIAGELDR